MAYQLQSYVWKVFSGAIDDVASEAYAQRAAALENFYRRRSKLVSRLGTQQIGALESDHDVDGLQWNQIGSSQYLLTLFQGSLRDSFVDPQTVITSGSRFTSAKEGSMAWVDQRVFIGTGYDQNCYFTGTQVHQAMPDVAPTGMVASVRFFTGGVLPGVYSYAVTFVNQAGDYTVPTLMAGTVTVNSAVSSGETLRLSGIPTATAGQDSIARQIWRTTANGGDYFLLTQINDNTTTIYDDTISDSALPTTRLLFENTRMPPCRYLVEWNNRLAGAGCYTSEGDTQTLYVSNARQPWYSPLLPNSDLHPGEAPDPNQGGRFAVQDRSGAGWTGLHVHGGALVGFTGGAGHILLELGDGTFRLQRFCDHGCVSHRTIVSAHSTLLWLGNDGAYSWDNSAGGDSVKRISDDEYTTIIQENSANAGKASAFFWDERYYLCYPDRTLVYDIKYNQWSTVVNAAQAAIWSWRITTTTVFTSDQKPRIYAAPVNLGQIWQAEIGTTDGGQSIPLRWRSGDSELGQSGPIPTQWPTLYYPAGGELRQKLILFMGANFKAAPGQTATINLYRGTAQTAPFDSFTWDLGKTVDQEVVVDVGDSQASRFYDRVSGGARDEFFAVEVKLAATAAIEFLQADLHYQIVK